MPWRVYRPGDRGRALRDRRDGQDRRPLLLLPAAQAAARRPARLAAAGRASTSATPTSCRSTTSPRRWTTSPTCPTATARRSTWSTPSRSRVVDVINLFCAAAGAPRFATPIDRRVTSAGPLGLVPRGPAPARPSLGAVRPLGAGPGWCSTRRSAGSGIPAEVLGHTSFTAVFDSRRTEQALAGSGIAVPDLESYARTLWGYWEDHLDQATGRDRATRAALQGKHVVITGASSGIGQVTALKVAQAGGIPVLVARGKDKLEETRAMIEMRGGTAHVYACDLSDLESIDRLCEQVSAELPSVDFVINNAGRSIRRSLRLSQDRFHDFERTMQLNYFGAVRLVMGLMPAMQRQQSRPRRQRQLDRRADQPAALLGVRRVQGRPGLVVQRGGQRGRRQRHHVHQHPHAAGADADDRADQALRQVPDDQPGAGRRHRRSGRWWSGRTRSTPPSATSAPSRTRWPPRRPSGCSTWPTTSSPTRPRPRARPPRAAPGSPSRSCWRRMFKGVHW